MPRRGENIYKRKDGRWEGRILLCTGKYRYLYAKSYKEVKEKMRDFLELKYIKEEKDICRTENAASLFKAWLEGDIRHQVKPTTYESYYCSAYRYIIPFFEQEGNESITEDSVSRFVKNIRQNTLIKESSRKKVLSIFKSALKEILQDSPECLYLTKLIKLPRTEEKEVEVFSMKEQRKIEYAALNSENKRALGIILCFYTGIRLGELCGLKWRDIDMESGTLSIVRTVFRTKNFNPEGTKTVLQAGSPKSRKSIRKIPLPEFLLKMLADSELNIEKEDCYMLSGNDKPYDPRSYQKLYKRILERAGVKERKFHAIRHTFATRALELGVDIKTLSEILGHSSVGITLNIYAHSLMEQKKIAIGKFNEMLVDNAEIVTYAVTSSVRASVNAR